MNFNFKKLPPFKWFVLQNFPFIEADFDAITYYQLLCKIVEYLNKVIDENNVIGEQTEKLTNAFNELQDYVNHYFDNLDIQDEINNKLDEMAESGQLTEIIAQYLQLAGVLAFDTLNDLKNATNLVNGSIAKTLGTNSYNDGFGYFYKIRNILNTDIVDNDNIVALTNFNNLVAEKIKKIKYVFNNVEDMKKYSILKIGDFVKTLGFYQPNDNGESLYYIRNLFENEITNNMDIIQLDNGLVAELKHNTIINIMQLGAVPVDSGYSEVLETKYIFERILQLLDETGGEIVIPNGTFVTSGDVYINSKKSITITGQGISNTNLWYSGNNTNIFWVQNNRNDNVDLLFVPVIIKNMTIRGINGSGTGFIISDRFGCKIENIKTEDFHLGDFVKLYNFKGWTEGTQIIDCIIRDAKYGITFERNLLSETATESFNNTIIKGCSMDISQNGGSFINMERTMDENHKLICYNAIIEATCWYGTQETTDKHIFKIGNWNILQGVANVSQDGLLNDNTTQAIWVDNNGQLNLEGSFLYNNATVLNIQEYSIINLINHANNFGPYRQQTLRYKGLRIVNGKPLTTANANSVIYSSGKLPQFSEFNVKINYEINGAMRCQTWKITTTTDDFTICCNPTVIGPDMVYVRPKNGQNQGVLSQGNGCEFEIYVANIEANSLISFEIEMQ